MQITIPKDAEASLRAQAEAHGFDRIDDYILSRLEIDGKLQPSPPMSYEQWRREFEAFLSSLTPSNPDFDDSRESIYPDR